MGAAARLNGSDLLWVPDIGDVKDSYAAETIFLRNRDGAFLLGLFVLIICGLASRRVVFFIFIFVFFGVWFLIVLIFLLIWRRGVRWESLGAAIQASVRHLDGHEEQILVHRNIALSARADHGREQFRLRRLGDIENIDAVEIPLEKVVPLKGKVGVGKGELRNDQLERLGYLGQPGFGHAQLSQSLLHLRIVGISGSKLKRVGLLEELEVLDTHGGFSRVVESGSELGAGIIYVGPLHPRGQSWRGLRGKGIFFFILVFLVRFLDGRRFLRILRLILLGSSGWSGGLRRLSMRSGNSETEKKHSSHRPQDKTGQSVHHFSFCTFSNMFSIMRISARCALSASVAKLNNSASCPAPAVSNRSFTMVNAPL